MLNDLTPTSQFKHLEIQGMRYVAETRPDTQACNKNAFDDSSLVSIGVESEKLASTHRSKGVEAVNVRVVHFARLIKRLRNVDSTK